MKLLVIILIVAVIAIYGDFVISKAPLGLFSPLKQGIAKCAEFTNKLPNSGLLGYFNSNRVKTEFSKEIKEARAEAEKGKEFLLKFSINSVKSTFPLNLIFK